MKMPVELKRAIVFLIIMIISGVLFITWSYTRISNAYTFSYECKKHIEVAMKSIDPLVAKAELEKAIEFAEANNLTSGTVSIFFSSPKNNVGFWYDNLCNAYASLENLSSPLEISTALINARGGLIEDTGNVYYPMGISVYPNNKCLLFLGLGSFIFFIVSLIGFCAQEPAFNLKYYISRRKTEKEKEKGCSI